MAAHPRSRRSFLRTLTISVVAAAGGWRFLTPSRVPETRPVSVPIGDVPPGGALVLPEEGVAVTRERSGELGVLSLTCTHLGCRVMATEGGFTCPCHGSTFDRKGRVLKGPARLPLHPVPWSQRDGVLRIVA